MSEPEETQAHIDHLKWEQDHLNWSAEHMKALSVLRRVEAHLFAHEAHNLTHRAEIARHDEAHIHGSQHLPTSQTNDHHALGAQHTDESRNHAKLIEAVLALEKVLA
jgi:hypothetical protein